MKLQQKLNRIYSLRNKRFKWLKKNRPFVIIDPVPKDIKDFCQIMREK